MDDLVAATGASKHAIYAEFGCKRDLFLAALDAYRDEVVTPAFSCVEADGADLAQVAQYFEFQISRAEDAGLPGPGCFFANCAAEIAPHDDAIGARVRTHNARLFEGFHRALQATVRDRLSVPPDEIAGLASAMVVFAAGLWTASRSIRDADALRRSVEAFLAAIKRALG
jgi:TetR/AcrR family transcriptional regulator, transcriptional repressor for nem operon